MKTVLHSYKFDIRNEAEYAEYNALHSMLRAAGLECFRALAQSPIGKEINHRALDGKEVELETKHLFDNQWNSAPGTGGSENGWRLFDWCEPIYPNANLRTGYWLEQTDEMKAIRSNTAKCGYCGAMAPVGAMEFWAVFKVEVLVGVGPATDDPAPSLDGVHDERDDREGDEEGDAQAFPAVSQELGRFVTRE